MNENKVFRIYDGGNNTIQGWNSSSSFPYDSRNRATVVDPDGATAKHEITSIPSPFARIDLVKAAFREVCKPDPENNNQPNLDGKTIFHKMVSDSLDVGEIFFNIDRYSALVDIIPCDIRGMIASLQKNPNTFILANALDKYFQSDGKYYNFNALQNIYILNYKQGPAQLNIIGASSPATLFFSTANDLSYVKGIYFNQDVPFDNDYQPLYKRDPEYVKALFTMKETMPNFATLFPEVYQYLDETFKCLPQNQQNDIRGVSQDTINSFGRISVLIGQNNFDAEVLGYPIFKALPRAVAGISQFTIRPTVQHTNANQLPLVLPVECGNKYTGLNYVTGKWGGNYRAPYKDTQSDYTLRALPYNGSRNPYIAISDLLEDTLVRIPHDLNEAYYFDGNISGADGDSQQSYLLPIKPLFFKFFTSDDLINGIDGVQIFEIKPVNINGAMNITLRIPIVGDGNVTYIEYNRTYYASRADISAGKNQGGIKDVDFTGLIMPLVRFDNPDEAYYTVALVGSQDNKYTYSFYDGDGVLPGITGVSRSEEQEGYKSTNYTIKGKNFCCIRVNVGSGVHGMIVPKFRSQGQSQAFSFAIDLGTSNTHIEYRCDTEQSRDSKPFAYGPQDALICMIHKPHFENNVQEDLTSELPLIIKDFLPEQVGVGGDYMFPTRTVLSYAKNIRWSDQQEPFMRCNIPLTYDKRRDMPYNRIKSDIKWGTEANDNRAFETYVDCLMLMLRNKVLLNNGNLSETKVTWFYPLSMGRNRVQQLTDTWNDYYRKYFDHNGSTTGISESLAPISYYFANHATATRLINIDMGGGTTDVAFSVDKNVEYVTSFRYATNALFEDAFADQNTTNGIVDAYRERIVGVLRKNGKVGELVAIADNESNKLPANMASFLFSLKDSSVIRNNKVNTNDVDFARKLSQDGDFKIVLILFYAAIIYHIAYIVKTAGIKEPRHISFSGNGSKIIQAISTDPKFIADISKAIFEKVLGRDYDKDGLEILGLKGGVNPKETTCKGGMIGVNDGNPETVILKGDNSGLVSSDGTYGENDDEYREKVVSAVKDFFNYVLNDLNKKFRFTKNLGVKESSLDCAKQVIERDMRTFLDKGIDQRVGESRERYVEETSFFYPVKGVLNSLSQKIYEEQHK